MNGIVIGAMMAFSLVQQTDTTFAVGNATRLDLENEGGQVVVAVWDRNEIRIQAEHSRRSVIEVHQNRGEISIEADAVRGGMSGIVDYTITVPRGFDLSIETMYSDIAIDGADGVVEAETLQGDIMIRGGRGEVHASSTTGRVRIEGAEGRIEVETVAQEIRISDSSGEILAESVGGSIIMENVSASSVDAVTVGGAKRIGRPCSFRPRARSTRTNCAVVSCLDSSTTPKPARSSAFVSEAWPTAQAFRSDPRSKPFLMISRLWKRRREIFHKRMPARE